MRCTIETILRLLAIVAACGGGWSGAAHAAEDETPIQGGSSVGVAAGILPPPGVYGSLQTTRSGLTVKSGDGANTPVKISSYGVDAGLLWVPNIKILGASYGVGMFQPLRALTLATPQARQQVIGTGNTMLNLSTLSWNLGQGLHASVGANLFLSDIDYRFGKSANVGHNFTTFEPHAAVTYLVGTWALTGSVLFDVNSQNGATHYLSGNDVIVDLTALRAMGRWEFGLGSEVLRQVSPDQRNGLVVPAIANGHGKGSRSRDVSLGPIAGYDFGKVNVQAYYQQSISAANMAAGFEVGLRASFPIGASEAMTQVQLDAVGRR